MLLKAAPPDPSMKEAKVFISQPRRIAAKALVERLRSVEPELCDQIALRMGHGIRGKLLKVTVPFVSASFFLTFYWYIAEYETPRTRAWFVTTGYLVRLMANHPERFDDVTYLIIDEVHERSVDTDILCLLCRRLLRSNPHIRLILMSATLAAHLYQTYFDVADPPIRVGARRFPVQEIYLEDIKGIVTLPAKEERNLQALKEECAGMKCKKPPSMSYMDKLYSLVAYLSTVVAQPGSSAIIFVPGMNDIVSITELVDHLCVPGVTFSCFPVHSDIPFEDQMKVFEATAPDEVRIIIATNAAESSVTLPDVDHVFCLGLCKQIVYNPMSHRQMLLPTWISRASATQRAGRTGRVRPGRVYRMYTRETYENHMDEYEPGELLRIPLDSVILMLKSLLAEENVSGVLMECLETPDMMRIDRSFESLFRSQFITLPDESCDITTLGSFVSALGIDLALGSLIGLGIQFGVGMEAIQMAAVLSFPKTPWVMSSPLVHGDADYNGKSI
jgi:HrpA-like RNA helicase